MTRTELRSVADVGALVHSQRKAAKLSQAELARRARTTRQWIIQIEHGAPNLRADIAARVLEALSLELIVVHDLPPLPPLKPRSAIERRVAELLSQAVNST